MRPVHQSEDQIAPYIYMPPLYVAYLYEERCINKYYLRFGFERRTDLMFIYQHYPQHFYQKKRKKAITCDTIFMIAFMPKQICDLKHVLIEYYVKNQKLIKYYPLIILIVELNFI